MAIKIPVDADISGLQRKVEALARTIEKTSRVKWNPVDSALIARETKKVEASIAQFYQRAGNTVMPGIRGLAPSTASSPQTSGGGVGSSRGSQAARGGGGGRVGGRGDFGIADIGRQFTGGVGGGFQTISSYAARGAQAGAAEGGGALGGAAGLLKGTAFGAAAFGALKVGQGISEGYDMARDRALGLDVLKRQMGDIGISFEKLKLYADKLSDGLGINSTEFVKLEQNLAKLSRTAESPEALATATAFGVGVSRSYGLEAGAAGNFLGGMRNIDPRQNNRELALILADTIARSGMNGRAEEVMQAITTFASTASRLSLTSPNVAAFGNAYGNLVGSHMPGMTPDAATNLLMQANAGVANMGAGAGEAGRAFVLSSFNRSGGAINPIQAQALAEGGLFGSRSSVFGGKSSIRQFIGDQGMGNLGGGPNANTTNFDAIRQQLGAMGGNKWFQLEGAQRLFGVQSLSQAAALMNLPQGQGNSLMGLMQSNNLDINKFSASGISRLGSISAAGTDQGRLSAIFEDMKKSGILSSDETRSVSSAEKASPAQFRDALIKVASMKDQTDDQGEQIRNQSASLDNIKINTGDKLLNPIIAMSDAIVAASGRGPQANRERVINISYDEAKEDNLATYKANTEAIHSRHLPLSQDIAAAEAEHRNFVQANQALETQRTAALKNAHSPYEITVNANVNVRTPDGKTQTTSSRSNVGAPAPSGTRTVTVGTH